MEINLYIFLKNFIMQNQVLKLSYIECGRMSENEMDNIYAGAWTCEEYHKCTCKKKSGKSTCNGGYQNCSDSDPWSYTTCKTEYSWVADPGSIESETINY